jgi:hypothetical protein
MVGSLRSLLEIGDRVLARQKDARKNAPESDGFLACQTCAKSLTMPIRSDRNQYSLHAGVLPCVGQGGRRVAPRRPSAFMCPREAPLPLSDQQGTGVNPAPSTGASRLRRLPPTGPRLLTVRRPYAQDVATFSQAAANDFQAVSSTFPRCSRISSRCSRECKRAFKRRRQLQQASRQGPDATTYLPSGFGLRL